MGWEYSSFINCERRETSKDFSHDHSDPGVQAVLCCCATCLVLCSSCAQMFWLGGWWALTCQPEAGCALWLLSVWGEQTWSVCRLWLDLHTQSSPSETGHPLSCLPLSLSLPVDWLFRSIRMDFLLLLRSCLYHMVQSFAKFRSFQQRQSQIWSCTIKTYECHMLTWVFGLFTA